MTEAVETIDRLFLGLCVCSTGLELHVKEQVRKVVKSCGGVFEDDLDVTKTTHLVAVAAGSSKYRAAVFERISVVDPRWVFDSYRSHQLLETSPYALQPLQGLAVCSSGLDENMKEQVMHLTESNGGIFDGDLEVGRTDILIAQRPEGNKYEAAKEYGIPVVHASWLHACIELGYLADESEHSLESTQEQYQSASVVLSSLQKHLQDACDSLPTYISRYHLTSGETEDNTSQLDVDTKEFIDMFDTLTCMCIGFPKDAYRMLEKLIRIGMGSILQEYNSHLVTHVIVSPMLNERSPDLVSLQQQVSLTKARGRVHFVSVRWVIDSLKVQNLEPEELYPMELHTFAEKDEVKTADKFQAADYPEPEDADDVQTWDQSTPVKSSTKGPLFNGLEFMIVSSACDDEQSTQKWIKLLKEKSAVGTVFPIDGSDVIYLDPAQVQTLDYIVISAGATLPASSVQFLIDQVTSADASTSKKRKRGNKKLRIVSDLWTLCCLEANVRLSRDAHELFALRGNWQLSSHSKSRTQSVGSLLESPVPIDGFERVVASTSVYMGVDRLVAQELVRLAGGSVTSKLNKSNSHLVCEKPFGMKFEKAKQWGIHVITAQWALQSIVQGRRLDENEYRTEDVKN